MRKKVVSKDLLRSNESNDNISKKGKIYTMPPQIPSEI